MLCCSTGCLVQTSHKFQWYKNVSKTPLWFTVNKLAINLQSDFNGLVIFIPRWSVLLGKNHIAHPLPFITVIIITFMTIVNIKNIKIYDYSIKISSSGTLEPTYRQLQTMKLDKSPFVIISVIGQELLAQTKYNAAVQVLQSALKIGTCSLKLRGSVFSALSSAYWALNSLDKVKNI